MRTYPIDNSIDTFAVLYVDGYTVHMPLSPIDLSEIELNGVDCEIEKWILYYKGVRHDGTYSEIRELYDSIRSY